MRTNELKMLCDEHDPWPLFERLLNMKLKPHQTIKSPFRQDRTPSFGVYRGQDGKVRFKDFADKYGDIYEFVRVWYNVDYHKAVRVVADMLDIKPTVVPPPAMRVKAIAERIRTERPAICSFEERRWEPDDDHFWEGFNVTQELLRDYDVFACSYFEMVTRDERKLTWSYKEGRPLYVYKINDHLKLYDPASPDKKRRYIGNTRREDVFGLKQLHKRWPTTPIVINAGQKDALTTIANFNVRAIAFNAESLIPDTSVFLQLVKSTTADVYVLYDNDPTGVKYSKELCQRHPFLKRIPFEEFADVKDISNAVEHDRSRTLEQLRLHLGMQ